ncbi:hypothetical protein LXM94_01395, partial [Rhizobium sp. TRM95111]|nr:hypothetical protein [Rhizobium alarense]
AAAPAAAEPEPVLAPAGPVHAALMVRFARAGENGMLSTVLADTLDASLWLSERILLDLSGRQLAETLVALDLDRLDTVFILGRVYPHLAIGRAEALLDAIRRDEAFERVQSWQRADRYTHAAAANSDRPDDGTASHGEILPFAQRAG